MAHGLNTVIKSEIECNSGKPKNFHAMDQAMNGPTAPARPAATKMGSRRIFTPQFKLQVLESYRNDNDCKGNQRATARKYGIHRRQIQKWLQVENNLRSVVANSANHHQFHNNNNSTKQILLNNNNNNSEMMKIISTSTDTAITRHRVVVGSSSNNNMHKNSSTTKYMNKTQQYSNSSNLTNVGGFISPVLSYGCDQPAISFAHHPHHRIAPTPTSAQQHYESYESSSSASLSSPLQSSPNLSHYTPATTITNTCNNLMLSRNGNSSSPVHLSHHHPYPQVPTFVSPPSSLNSYHIIKPEPHLPVPSHHLLPTSSHFIADPHYYPAPVPCSTPLPMPLYPTISPRLTRTCPDSSELQLKQNMESAIDLSMPMHQKRIISSSKYVESRTPSPYDAKWVNVNNNTASNATDSDAIDLTCKKRKHSSSSNNNGSDNEHDNATPPAKVPKLFKPYLLDADEDHHPENDDEGHQSSTNTKSEGFKKNFIVSDDGHHRQKDAIIWNNHSAFSQYDSYRTPDFSPNSSVSYASPPYTMSPYCEVPYHNQLHHPPQSSPVSGYESSTSSIYSDESPPTGYSIAFKLQDVDTTFNTFHTSERNSTMIYA